MARLLREAEATAVTLLTDNRPALDRLAAELIAHETVDGSVVRAVARGESVALPV